jgi:sugar phosphate isomerase/epimerase
MLFPSYLVPLAAGKNHTMFKNLNVEALGVSGRPSEIIELALSNGFKGLDLDLTDFAAQVQTYGLAHARRVFDSSRLKLGSFPLVLDWDLDPLGFKKELEGQAKLFELAQQLGCTRAVTIVQPASDQRPYHENFDTHRRRYVDLGEVLAGHGIRLGVGLSTDSRLREGRAFQFIQAVDAFLMLFKSIDSANVGVALDLWHWHLGGGTLDQIRSIGDKIVTVSVADADPGMTARNADENTRRLPGETGVIDSTAVLTALSEVHYDGPVTAMPSKASFSGLGREKIVKQTAAALDTIWKAAGLGVRPGAMSRR